MKFRIYIFLLIVISLLPNLLIADDSSTEKDIYQICKEWYDSVQVNEIKTIDQRIESLERQAEQSEPDSHKVNLILRSASLNGQIYQNEKKLDLARQAKKLALQLNYSSGIVRALFSEVKALNSANKKEEAKSKLKRAYYICDSINKPIFKLRKSISVANKLMDQEHYDSSLVCFFEALELAKTLKHEKLISEIYEDISYVYYYTDQLELEEKYIALNLRSRIKQGAMVKIASGLNDLGSHYSMVPSFVQSTQAYLLAFDICKRLDFTAVSAALLSNIADNYEMLNENKKALKNYQLAAEINLKTGNKDWLGHNYRGFTTLLIKSERYKEALRYARMALELSKQEKDKYNLMIDTLEIGNLHMKMGRFQQAINCLFVADKKASKYFHSEISWAKAKLGETFLELIKSGKEEIMFDTLGKQIPRSSYGKLAKKYLEEALSNDEELEGFIEAKSRRQKLMAEVYFLEEEFKKGYLALSKYQQLSDSIFSLEKRRELTGVALKRKMEKDSLNNLQARMRSDADHNLEMAKKDKQRFVSIVSGLAILLLAGGLYGRLRFTNKAKKEIEIEKKRSDDLLLNILPEEVAEELKAEGAYKAKNYEAVTILFTDLVGFTEIASKLTADELVSEVGQLFRAFDAICEKYHIEKIKTIGDAYMAASGLNHDEQNETEYTAHLVRAALEMQDVLAKGVSTNNTSRFQMRCGIHTGPVVAGIVGVKKFQYDIWGDTVNTASRMESHGEVGKVNISQATYLLLKDDPQFTFESRGMIEAKGKGGDGTRLFVSLKEQ